MIPPHYSDRFVNQRFNKALHIVQNLSPSSSFQPSKEQRLELYALYKQAVNGNINAPRPGIFDVVGRAKWDAWKKLEGVSSLEAKHGYVDILLRVAVEAYKRPETKAQAQHIIQTFATLQPTEDSGSDESESDSQQDEDSSVGSELAEEQAYLSEIQRNAGRGTPASRQRRLATMSPSQATRGSTPMSRTQTRGGTPMSPSQTRGSTPSRRPPSSVKASSVISGSGQTFMTADSRRPSFASSQTREPTPVRAPSAASATSSNATPKQTRPLFDDTFDPNVNPWASTSSQRYKVDDGQSSRSSTDHDLASRATFTTISTNPPLPPPVTSKPVAAASPMVHDGFSPHHGSSASSVTATGALATSQQGPLADSHQYTSVVALGPATKRALDTLQAEIVALNERIDGLREELARRDRERERERELEQQMEREKLMMSRASERGDGNDWERWRWIVRTCAKHAVLHLMTALFVILVFYRLGYRGQNPFDLRQLWQKLRIRFLISKILV